MEFLVKRSGLFSGLGGWFEACLTGRVTISTFRGTTWRNFFLPLESPVQVEPGDRIQAKVGIETRRCGYQVRWEGTISGRQRRVCFYQSTR